MCKVQPHLEAVDSWQASAVWHKAFGHHDVSILDTSQCYLVFNFGGFEPLCAFLHHKCVHLTGLVVSGPNDHPVCKGCIAYPSLEAVQLVTTLNLGGCCLKGACIAAIAGLSQAPSPGGFESSQIRQQLLLLFLRAEKVDGQHAEAVVYHEESAHAAIDSCKLYACQACLYNTLAGTTVAFDSAAAKTKFGELRDNLVRELSTLPVGCNDWRYFCFLQKAGGSLQEERDAAKYSSRTCYLCDVATGEQVHVNAVICRLPFCLHIAKQHCSNLQLLPVVTCHELSDFILGLPLLVCQQLIPMQHVVTSFREVCHSLRLGERGVIARVSSKCGCRRQLVLTI